MRVSHELSQKGIMVSASGVRSIWLRNDLDLWIKRYNKFRPHSGKHCYGKTPMQTFLDAKYIVQEKRCDMLMGKSDSFNELINSIKAVG